MQRNNDNNDSSSSNNNNSSTHQACASCKHQRKKCNDDCVLAPCFPAQSTKEFQAVHKVFGVSNVQKMVRTVRDNDRTKVADSLIWEALWRQKDPVLGPYGEYRRICEELKLYKSLVHHHQPIIGWHNGNNNTLSNGSNNNNKAGLLIDAIGSTGGLSSVNNNGINNCLKDHGGDHVNGDNGGYSSRNLHGSWEKLKLKQEHQQSYAVINGFKQQYYLSDKF